MSSEPPSMSEIVWKFAALGLFALALAVKAISDLLERSL